MFHPYAAWLGCSSFISKADTGSTFAKITPELVIVKYKHSFLNEVLFEYFTSIYMRYLNSRYSLFSNGMLCLCVMSVSVKIVGKLEAGVNSNF